MEYGPDKYAMHMKLLEEAGFIVDDYTRRGDDKPFFVGLGSHGGIGKTPQRAAKACLACCGVGKFWKLNEHGQLARDEVDRIFEEVRRTNKVI